MKLLRSRFIKNIKRPYFADKVLRETNFEIGAHYKIKVDLKNRRLILMPSTNEADNTVCKRQHSDGVTPLFDIRDKNKLKMFENSDRLILTIYENQIVIEGYREVEKIKTSGSTMRILDLFSGAGLLSKAFKDAGFHIVKAFEGEVDCKGAIKTYKYNVGNHIERRDVISLKMDELPIVDGLIAGIPCDKLTTINTRTNIRKELDEGKKIINCKAFTLFKKTCEIIKKKVKSWFFLEEVVDIFTVDKGGLMKAIEDYLPSFKFTKYTVEASEYGTAQSRKRAFIIGSKIGEFEEPKKTHVDKKNTVGKALKNLDDSVPNQKDFSKARKLTIEKMKHIPQGGNWKHLPSEIRTGRFHNYLRRLDEYKISCTLANIRKNLIINPWKNRILSVRECARLMGLKDSFIFFGNLASMQQQVCQGVCYQPAKAFAIAIKKMIKRYNNKCNLKYITV